MENGSHNAPLLQQMSRDETGVSAFVLRYLPSIADHRVSLFLSERIECGDAGDLPLKRFSREPNVFFQCCSEFWDNALHICLCLGRKRFRTKLMNPRFGVGWHFCSLSDKRQSCEYWRNRRSKPTSDHLPPRRVKALRFDSPSQKGEPEGIEPSLPGEPY